MKKTLLTAMAVSCFALASMAQGVSFGLKAGVNFASQKFETDGFSVSPDGLIGFHVGGFATMMFSESFGLQPEVLFSTGGSKFDILGSTAETRVTYVTVPVMFRYQPIELLNLHAGPQFGFLMKAEWEADGQTDDIKDQMKGLDLGAGFGAGIDLPMGLGFTARYVLGLSNISDNDADEDGTIKNNAFQLSVTYRFGQN